MSTITWIKCSEALPDDDTTVLLALHCGDVIMGYHSETEWWDFDSSHHPVVPHWSHLPPHPDDEQPKDVRCPRCGSTDAHHSKVLCCMVEIERLRAELVEARKNVERLRAELEGNAI